MSHVKIPHFFQRNRRSYTFLYDWVALCQPAPSDYFVAIFQVAQNQLKFGMSTPFVLKNVPVGFFKNAEKYGQNCINFKLPPPPPPPLAPSVRLQTT